MKDTYIVKNLGKTWGGHCDIAPTVMARDWKGWNTYGSVAVIEYRTSNNNSNDDSKES